LKQLTWWKRLEALSLRRSKKRRRNWRRRGWRGRRKGRSMTTRVAAVLAVLDYGAAAVGARVNAGSLSPDSY